MSSEDFDLIVVGAGPAGGEAALGAAECGLRVVLLDEAPAPGGQGWRAPRTQAARTAPPDPDKAASEKLRARLAKAPITYLRGAQVWDARRGFCVSVVSQAGAQLITAPRIIVATGAIERVLPFPGWTLPGVFGLAAATALIKAENTLPGRSVVVAGQGPLLMAVAAKACALGLRPRAVVDLARPVDWACALPGLAVAPALMRRGMAWLVRLMAARIPVYRGAEVVAARGGEALEEIVIANRATGTRHVVAADTLFVGNGLSPADELARLLGAKQVCDPVQGGYRIVVDRDRRTGVTGLYAIGDGAGVRGAMPANAQGRIAGLAAAHDCGAIDAATLMIRSRKARRRLARLERFANASCRLMQFPVGQLARIPDETVICRCEDVTLSAMKNAMADGACDLNQLKHFTRLGMGPCQGRMCALNAADLMRLHGKPASEDLRLTPRSPLRPVDMQQLIGQFSYADIPVPEPAPL